MEKTTEITFFDPDRPENLTIVRADDHTTQELEKISELQAELGRTEMKIRRGWPVKCAWCGVTTRLSDTPDSHGICSVCAEKITEGRGCVDLDIAKYYKNLANNEN